MKKVGILVVMALLIVGLNVAPAHAQYLSEKDQYIEVSYDVARSIADKVGLKGVELGEETAQQSFEVQEDMIAQIEAITGQEIDHYYIWLTVNGEKVLGIDPPVPMFN